MAYRVVCNANSNAKKPLKMQPDTERSISETQSFVHLKRINNDPNPLIKKMPFILLLLAICDDFKVSSN